MRLTRWWLSLWLLLGLTMMARAASAALCSDVFPAALTEYAAAQLDLPPKPWSTSSWPGKGSSLTAGDYYFTGTTLTAANYNLSVAGSGTVRIFVDGDLTIVNKNLALNVGGNTSQLILIVDGNLYFSDKATGASINGIVYTTGFQYYDYNVWSSSVTPAVSGATTVLNGGGLLLLRSEHCGGAIHRSATMPMPSPMPISASSAPDPCPLCRCLTTSAVTPAVQLPATTAVPAGAAPGAGRRDRRSRMSALTRWSTRRTMVCPCGRTQALRLSQKNDRIAYRPLASTSTASSVYLSMLVRFNGTPGDNTFLGFWIQNPSYGESPQFGIKMNRGNGSGPEDFFVRLDTNGAYAKTLTPGQTYLLVAEFTKGAAGYYTQGKLWVDPDCEASPGPADASISVDPSVHVSQISEIGLRTDNLSSGSSFDVGQVAAGENWTDVVQCQCYQHGLVGNYYNGYASNQVFPTSGAALTRLDPQVDFDWANGSPDASVDSDRFAVEWTGSLEVPETGSYSFQTRSDDGVRLWVDDLSTPVIDNWTDHSARNNNSGAITLTKGVRYAVRMQFYENGGQAVASLRWATPSGSGYVPIPTNNLFACVPLAAPGLKSASAVCGDRSKVSVSFTRATGPAPWTRPAPETSVITAWSIPARAPQSPSAARPWTQPATTSTSASTACCRMATAID